MIASVQTLHAHTHPYDILQLEHYKSLTFQLSIKDDDAGGRELR